MKNESKLMRKVAQEEPAKKTTLVERFIETALAEHEEPERRGTSRGEPIGFSRTKKTAAILLALSGKTERELATELGISESLLRKWRCEDAFIALMRKHAYDFASFFTEQVRKEANELEKNPSSAEGNPLAKEEVLGPAAEVAISDAVEKAMEKEPLTWSQVALRHATALKAAKEGSGKPGKWILNRPPHDELLMLWQHGSSKGKGEGPLEAAVRTLRQRLFREAERMLTSEALSEEERQRVRLVLVELRESEEVLTMIKEEP